jgi:hypothetical protein
VTASPQVPRHLLTIAEYQALGEDNQDQPATLTTCHLAEGFGYQDGGPATGLVEITEPFLLRIDLERLLDG